MLVESAPPCALLFILASVYPLLSSTLIFQTASQVVPELGTAVPGPGGVPQVANTRIYRPWHPQDLISWSQQTPRLREDPEKVLQVMKGILWAYDPAWGDVQVLLEVLFTLDEKY